MGSEVWNEDRENVKSIDDVILAIQWRREDIMEAEGIPSTEERLSRFLTEPNLRMIQEQSIERGWDVIYSLLKEKFFDGVEKEI